MSKEQTKAGVDVGAVVTTRDDDLAWENLVALIPTHISFNNVPAGTGFDGSDFEPVVKQRRPILVSYQEDTEDNRNAFYAALLEIPWLAPKVRNAIVRELGRSPREEDVGIERARNLTMRMMINERKELMRKNGDRPRGGVHEAAVAAIAHEQGLSVSALKWRLRGLKRPW